MERRAGGGTGRVAGLLFGLLAAAAVIATAHPEAPEPQFAVQVLPPGRSPAARPAPIAALQQRVLVVAATRHSTTARLTLWQRRGTAPWRRADAAVTVHLGAAGLTRHPREGDPATPLGTFALTRAFGRDADRGGRLTRLPYRQLRPGDGWNTAPGAGYNRLGHTGELYDGRDGWARAAVLIDYNVRNPRAGAGSGFFVHVAGGGPTRGCVALPRPAMFRLLRWLDPAAHPRIVIALR